MLLAILSSLDKLILYICSAQVVELGREQAWQNEADVTQILRSFQVIEVNVFVFAVPEDAYFEILRLGLVSRA